MILHFYHKKTTLAKLLYWFGDGTKNHVSIEFEGDVYEALGGRWAANGVIMSPGHLTQHQGRRAPISVESYEINVSIGQAVKLEKFLKSQVGKKYDYKAILGFLARGVKQNRQAWFCSEIAARALEIATKKEFNIKRVSPSILFDVVKFPQGNKL